MVPVMAAGFALDRRLERDTEPLMWLGLCELRVMNDSRWPWVVLIPQRPGIEEIHDLTPLDQAMLTFETAMVGQAVKTATGCRKINVGALGNVVPQLHVHVIARDEGDPFWPGPVWGNGPALPWRREDLHRFVDRVKQNL